MPLERRHVQRLLTDVARTREDDIDCGECLASMAEFAELELVGTEIPQALRVIEAHLALCPECAEEYAVLLEVVRAAAGDPML